MFVTSNVYLNIMFLHIACGFELLHNPFKVFNICCSIHSHKDVCILFYSNFGVYLKQVKHMGNDQICRYTARQI